MFYIKKRNQYFNERNEKLTDSKKIEVLNGIYMPPVYKDVKYYYIPKDSYATGVDSIGRIQHKYTKEHTLRRNASKKKTLIDVNKKIKKIKKKIDDDLLKNNFPKERNIALILKLMNQCHFRIGNKQYEEKYGSIGLTTLQKEHIKINKNKIYIEFIGKKGVENKCLLKDKQLATILKKLYQTNDSYLFSYLNENHESRNISVNDVNQYLDEFEITNKDLRMWNANYLFLKFLHQELKKNTSFVNTKTNKKKLIKLAVEKTAHYMHNTPTVCKSSYICKDMYNQLLDKNKLFIELQKPKVNIMDLIKNH